MFNYIECLDFRPDVDKRSGLHTAGARTCNDTELVWYVIFAQPISRFSALFDRLESATYLVISVLPVLPSMGKEAFSKSGKLLSRL